MIVQLLCHASELVGVAVTEQIRHFFQQFIRRKIPSANEDASSQVAQRVRDVIFNMVNITVSLKNLCERPINRRKVFAVKIVHMMTLIVKARGERFRPAYHTQRSWTTRPWTSVKR